MEEHGLHCVLSDVSTETETSFAKQNEKKRDQGRNERGKTRNLISMWYYGYRPKSSLVVLGSSLQVG